MTNELLAALKRQLRIEPDDELEVELHMSNLESAIKEYEATARKAFEETDVLAKDAVILLAAHKYSEREESNKEAYETSLKAFERLSKLGRDEATMF